MKKYVFKPYNKIFPELFQKEKQRIAASVEKDAVIEHIGSTAVPSLGGKGIIDIAIALKKEKWDKVSQPLQSLGYEFRPTFSTADRLYFIIYLPDSEEGIRRYHVHLTYPENNEWKEFLAFRDYLRKYPEAMHEYAQMKQAAAQEANHDGTHYRKLKSPMFEKMKFSAKLTTQHCLPQFHFSFAKPSQRSLLDQWFEQKHIPESPDAITLNLFICDLNYLGKGIAVPMIREFLITQFPEKKRVLIDPEATNRRAIHVYQKIGFKIIKEFIASWHPVPHYQMELEMCHLLDTLK